MEDEESIVREFLVECSEGLGRLDQELVLLEKEPTNAALLGSIFRTLHTIKGTCGFIGLVKLENITHRAENILSMTRDGKMTVTPEVITVFLEAVDAVKEILCHIETHGKEPDKDYEIVRQRLDDLLGGNPAIPDPASRIPEFSKVESSQETAWQAKDPSTLSQENALSATESSIRVSVSLLDKMMNLVGELVLARNQLLQRVREREDAADVATSQRLNLITTELQESIMKTRMQPIRNIWEKIPRVVRDLARSSGKEVELVMEGAETELDKTLLEAIKDPFTHIVRNAVDHGIETPESRRKKGKPEKGTLFLKAYHDGGQINIEITDDGGGIDAKKVKEKAVEKKLLSPEAVSRLSDREALDLIFLPGLSTAEKVTHISGRGVGMDVVKNNIEKIGGSLELTSFLGYGTLLRIKIPLTLAIIPALIVASSHELFAIPQANLLELVRVGEESEVKIEVIQNSEFYRLRGNLLPLLRLGELLKLQEKKASEKEATLVVLQAGSHSFGLVVDEIKDSQEIVVKPLGRQLKGLSVFSGATIMGDGRVSLILDVAGIAKEGGLLRTSSENIHLKIDSESETEHAPEAVQQSLIIFSISGQDRYAIPLSLVDRLEEFESDDIEQATGREVIQYRGTLLPLIRLDRVLDAETPQNKGSTFPVIVFSEGDKSVGLVVGRILDITDEPLSIHPSPQTKTGIRGTAVVQGKTTDLLDVYQVIETIFPGWFKSDRGRGSRGGSRILLAEGSALSRGILRQQLEMDGYQVMEASDGQEAIRYLSENQVDLVLSDVDMPKMNGMDMVKKIRSLPQYRELPVLALTSLESETDRMMGIEAGFAEYLMKFDRDSVLSAILRHLSLRHVRTKEREEIHA